MRTPEYSCTDAIFLAVLSIARGALRSGVVDCTLRGPVPACSAARAVRSLQWWADTHDTWLSEIGTDVGRRTRVSIDNGVGDGQGVFPLTPRSWSPNDPTRQRSTRHPG